MQPDHAYIEELRRREWKKEALSEQEQADLAAFYRRIEEQEETVLAPAFARWEREQQEREEKLRRIEAVRDRLRTSLSALQDLRREIDALKAEEENLLASVRQ